MAQRKGALSRSSRYVWTDLWLPELSTTADSPTLLLGAVPGWAARKGLRLLRVSGLPGAGAKARLSVLR